MTQTTLPTPHKRALLALQIALLLIAGADILLPHVGIAVPTAWVLAAGLACLIAMMLVFVRAGLARARFVGMFVAGLTAAVGLAWWVTRG